MRRGAHRRGRPRGPRVRYRVGCGARPSSAASRAARASRDSRRVFVRMVRGGRSFRASMRARASSAPKRATQRSASQVGNEQRMARASTASAGGAGSRSRAPRRAKERRTAFTNPATPGLPPARVTASSTAANDGHALEEDDLVGRQPEQRQHARVQRRKRRGASAGRAPSRGSAASGGCRTPARWRGPRRAYRAAVAPGRPRGRDRRTRRRAPRAPARGRPPPGRAPGPGAVTER